jgi:DNA (cytosine-5)-methyltransferase 1
MTQWANRNRNARAKRAENDIVCVDLFCGAGGLTNGLLRAGVKVRAGVDFEEACRYPYEANHEGIAFHQADVAELEASKVAEWFGAAKVRVLAGCAPCQPFSTYALRYQKDEDVEDDQRWSLLNHFGKLVRELLPDIVTMENVPTVTRHSVFNNFKSTLESLGYKVWVDVIDCAQYGLPQRRNRTVLLASLHADIKLRESLASEARTVEDVIKHMPVLRHGRIHKSDRLHAASRLSDLNYERIRHSKPGGTWRDWPRHLVAKCHTKSTGKKYPAVYGRMRYDEPAPTLTTQFYGFGNGRFGHPTQRRGLSLREGAMLQGFPKDYKFIPEDAEIQFKALGRMIGNAVPVDLGRVIGESIIEHVLQNRDAFTKNVKNVDRPSSSAKHRRGRNDREHEGRTVVR